ncbi:MAG: tripartite tricarboxylate transporter substrate-binding protein [Alphaproteobacteria bacterium]|nr:tripartite tricarboxylate transporter substrate-binding protein [Alphaproteobacteria bacterium]
MRKSAIFMTGLGLGLAALSGALAPAAAESAMEFYKGKRIYLKIGSQTGGGYDTIGRAIARFMDKHIPGEPKIIVQNIPGGGSLRMMNQIYNTGKKDGSEFGLGSSGMPTTPLLNPKAAKYDPQKLLWIGSPTKIVEILMVSDKSPVQTLDGIYKTQLVIGASSPGSATLDFPYITNAISGTKFKIVAGYKGAGGVALAMQRGEVFGIAGFALASLNSSRWKTMADKGEVKVLAQFGFKPSKRIPNVPLFKLPTNDADMQIIRILYSRMDYGRPFFAVPGVPADRLDALRTAFAKTMTDKGFLAQAKKLQLYIDPATPEELAALTTQLYSTPKPVIERLINLTDRMRKENRKKKRKKKKTTQ